MKLNKKNHLIRLAAILLIFSCGFALEVPGQTLPAYTPPPGSPLARKVHPRLFFTAETVPVMRQRLNTIYAAEFQSFISEMDGLYDEPIDAIPQNYKFADARNFAFLYLMDPAQMPAFRFGHARHEYGRRAIELALKIATIRGYTDGHYSHALRSIAGGYINLALACVYDWCFSMLTPPEKKKIAQGLIDLYTHREKDANPGQHVQLSNQLLGHAHHGSVGALAIWGDGLGEPYDAKAQEMLDFMKAMYLDRVFDTATHVMENSSGWSEGWNYQYLSFNNAKVFAGIAGTALGTNFFKTCSWFRQYPLQFLCNIIPYKIDGEYLISRNDAGQLEKVVRESFTRSLITVCAALAKDDPNMAGLAKWLLDTYGKNFNENPRAYSLFYDFIWGCKDVQARSPQQLNLALTQKLGLGQIVMRSSWDDDATRVTFWAMKWWVAPHAHYDQASFTIEKFGPLALDAGVDKGGGFDMGKSKFSRATINHNVVGVRNPLEKRNELLDYQMDVEGDADIYTDPSYQPGGKNHIGELEAFESVPGEYDYLNYNYTRSYRGGQTVNLARREFIYLRPPNPAAPNDQEYVIITDKINTLKAEYEKRFILHVSFKPEITDGTWTVINEGVSESTTGRTVRITNTYGECHGRMFMKSIFPAETKLVRIGGPEQYWFTDADYNDISLRPPFNELTALWGGSYRIEVKPVVPRTYDIFLTVLQIGDANTLHQMAEAAELRGAQFFGTYIKDQHVILFANGEHPLGHAEWTIQSHAEVEHLLVDLQPGTLYWITRNGLPLRNGQVSTQGTLWFRDHPRGKATYRLKTIDRNNVWLALQEISNFKRPVTQARLQ
ncbi:MAG: hypothetical protein ONB44_09025 [candidate division KSB1 bacterium]|nr:hypothetical protein [candidate division KSB1 bacterium]MDZ7302273.1 hypothetical protein [candidate division KSB1 bacterium]MDZ7311379.1 hypothetical protein [candidate division KSB1 bacterium]